MASTIVQGTTKQVPFEINSTDLLAGTSFEMVAPMDGYVKGLYTIVQAAVTTGGVVTVNVGTTAVDGIAITVADAATKGTVQSDLSTVGHASRAVSKGDRIQVVPSAAFATAGALNGFVEFSSAE